MSQRVESPAWECVLDVKATVSEVPIWSTHEDALYWLDIFEPSLSRTTFDGDGGTQTWSLPDVAGSYVLCEDGTGAVVATGDGLHFLAFDSGALTRLYDPPYDRFHFRFNDGRCDRRGRYWVGSLRTRGSPMPDGSGAFWRLDRNGLSRQLEGITVANGIAFSPSGEIMYLADSTSSEIWAYDYDADAGVATNRRCLAHLPAGWTPDGAAVDSGGCYWVAMFGAGRILRYAPDGTLDRDLQAPASHPTMVAFGGPRLDAVYVTTARRPLDDEALRAEPLAGGIFRCDVGAQGVPEPYFQELRRRGGQSDDQAREP